MKEHERRIAARAWLCAGVLLAAGALGIAAPAVAQGERGAAATTQDTRQHYAIAAGDLGRALDELAAQNRLQIGYQPQHVAGRSAPAVEGDYTLREALGLLLENSGLEAQFVSDSAIVVRRIVQTGVDAGSTAANIAGAGGIEEIIVTGQKREERLQDVPIAISAFSMDQLDNQKIEGGFDLLKAVPNVTFSKTNFTGYNFQIRGIGTQAVSATTDPGVAVSFNNTTLIVNRLFEQEYLDIERVEVLRGPQGTLYGRNATAGVINVISAKPKLGIHEGEVKVEAGNYGSQRFRGHYNLPIGDTLALRGAYASTVRDGYGYNEFDGSDVDNRDLWTGRLSLGWQPHDRLRANLLWERFREDDRRVRSIKQLCHHDPGRDVVAGFDVNSLAGNDWTTGLPMPDFYKGQLTQGCLPGSMYEDAAFGVPNGLALPFVSVGRLAPLAGNLGFNPYGLYTDEAPCDLYKTSTHVGVINLCNGDPFAGAVQSRDLRRIHSEIQPMYRAQADLVELSLDFDLSEQLLLSSQTVYVDDSVRSTQDLNRFATLPGFFSDSTKTCDNFPFYGCAPDTRGTWSEGLVAQLTPGGVFCDPQLGCSDHFRAMDLSRGVSSQFNQELRLVSSFDGDWNFSLGANFTRFRALNDYFVFANALSALAQTNPFRGIARYSPVLLCRPDGTNGAVVIDALVECVYVDQTPLDELIDGAQPEGHNYFLSRNPYELKSIATFGEAYWNVTDTLKITGGLRLTWDQKTFTPVPSQTLLSDFRKGQRQHQHPSQCVDYDVGDLCARQGTAVDGRGYPAEPDIVQEWLEPTGRLGFDWKPELELSWLDESLIYAFYTRGYKAGGANPPGMANPSGAFIEAAQGAVSPRVFEAEYVNAYEVGTKNRLLGGGMTLNANAFYYDYENYQVSKIVNRAAANENFDAKVWGAELELMFALPTDTLFNASFGYLRTRIADGERSIDLMNRTQDGGGMFVTAQRNPNFDPALTPRARADYQAGLNAPADQEFLAFDDWVLIKPSVIQTSNCIAPAALVRSAMEAGGNFTNSDVLSRFCPGGTIGAKSFTVEPVPGTDGVYFDPMTDAPNGSAGFFADLGGKRLPNAPRYTVSLGAQQTVYLPGGWDLTGRVDWYWQDDSYARVYNTEYDHLKAWTNTSFSLWLNQPAWDLRIEAYVKNAFDEAPITGTYLGSDDTGLTTNVFTLDPRLVGVSVTKRF